MTRSDSLRGKKRGSKQAPTKPAKNNDEQADLRRRYLEAQQLVQALKEEMRKRAGETAASKKPPRIPLWILIRDYLKEKDNEEPLENIVNYLVGQGHDLGKYPLRSVKVTVVSSHMRNVFNVTKLKNGTEMVRLVEGTTGPYTPVSHRLKARLGSSSPDDASSR
jgi:hypothetical protein